MAGFGALGVGAVVSFVIGGLLLFHRFGAPSPTMPDVSVNIWLVLGTGGVLMGGGAWINFYDSEVEAGGQSDTADSVVGEIGFVTSDLSPRGTVQLQSGLWTATAEDDEVIVAGERVRVVGLGGSSRKRAKDGVSEKEEKWFFWRIVKQYERMLVLRWGKFMDVRGPGLRLVIPFIDQPVKVDIREQVDRVPTQKYITSDNVVVDMDFVIYYRVLEGNDEVRRAVMDIENFRMATINLSFATLRAVDRLHEPVGGALGAGEDT